MTDALSAGASSTDGLQLLSSGNPLTPIGTETANPVRVRVTGVDGLPVEGATIAWDGGPGTVLGVCSLQRSCSALTDENGEAWTHVTVMSAGSNTITASLAPASYSPPKSVQAVVQGTSAALDIGIAPQYQRVPAGATIDLTLTARVVGNGAPIKSKTVTFQLTHGTGTLTPASAVTSASGYAATTLHIANSTGDTDVAACVSPGNTVCRTFEIYSVATANLRLEPVAGDGQMVATGQVFQPLSVRVTDAATPPNPVRGAAVVFEFTWMRPLRDEDGNNDGESTAGHHPLPVIIGMTKSTVVSDAEGIATLVPSAGTLRGALEAEIKITTGTSARLEAKIASAFVPGTNPASNPLPDEVRPIPTLLENRRSQE